MSHHDPLPEPARAAWRAFASNPSRDTLAAALKLTPRRKAFETIAFQGDEVYSLPVAPARKLAAMPAAWWRTRRPELLRLPEGGCRVAWGSGRLELRAPRYYETVLV